MSQGVGTRVAADRLALELSNPVVIRRKQGSPPEARLSQQQECNELGNHACDRLAAEQFCYPLMNARCPPQKQPLVQSHM